MSQLVIGITGVLALALIQFGGARKRLVGAWVGLAGQPFWLWEAWQAKQHGMLFISACYSAVFVVACWRGLPPSTPST